MRRPALTPKLLSSAAVGEHFAILHDAEEVIADPVVRNWGTVGGSLCQADPSEDLSAAFAALKARMVIHSPDGSRTLDLGSPQRNKHANLHKLAPNLRRRLGKYLNSTYFSFYIGTGDTRFLPDNRKLSGELHKYNVPHTKFKTYQGEHSMDLWREHATAWISRALSLAASPG